MATIIDQLYSDHKSLQSLLINQKEISLASDADNKLKKVLLLSAASYFEYEITSAVIQFVEAVSNNNSAMVAFVKARALERKYHDYFDWNGSNANKFFRAFGTEFANACKEQVKNDKNLDDSIKAFLEIGLDRNVMVHENFAVYPMNKTAEEVYAMYKRAEGFLSYIRRRLAETSGIQPVHEPEKPM